MDAYRRILGRAEGVAGTPYQQYGGNQIAPFNQDQQGAFQNFSQIPQQYLPTAVNYATQGASPITGGQIEQYYNPFQQGVTNATIGNINETNARQLAQVKGNAISQNALGGNRLGVGQGEVIRQQNLGNAPTLANLNAQNYQQAYGAAAADRAAKSQGAYTFGNLQNAALQGTSAWLQSGALQQQQAQRSLDLPYQQFVQQQAFPYQQTGWLAGLTSGIGSLSGGNSSTTSPGPDPWAQAIGIGLQAAPMLLSDRRVKKDVQKIGDTKDGQPIYRFRYRDDPTGAVHMGLLAQDVEKEHPEAVGDYYGIKTVDYDAATRDSARRAYADGGIASMPFAEGSGWIPSMQITRGSGPPKPPSMPPQQQDTGSSQMVSSAMNLAQKLKGMGSSFAQPYDNYDAIYAANNLSFGGPRADGGMVMPNNNGIFIPLKGYDLGGGIGIDSFGDRFAPATEMPSVGIKPEALTDSYFAQNGADPRAFTNSWQDNPPLPRARPEIQDEQTGVPLPTPRPQMADQGYTEDANYPDMSTPTQGIGIPVDGTAGEFNPQGGIGFSLPSLPERSKDGFGLLGLMPHSVAMPMMMAGAGMMASRSPFLGQAIGEGALKGLSSYEGQRKETQDRSQKEREFGLQTRRVDMEADRLSQAAKQAGERLANDTKRLDESLRHNQAVENKPIAVGSGQSLIDPRTGAVLHKSDSTMSDSAIEIAGHRLASGDLTALTNVGRGAQGDAKLSAITNKATEILVNDMGMSPKDAAAHISKNVQDFRAGQIAKSAGARTAATREANLDIILRATEAAVPAALEASAKLGRTGWVPINQIIQKGQVIASNPELREFGMANLQLAEHWARAMNPTGVMRESDRDLALHFLSTADSDSTYRRAVTQLQKQIRRERDAVRAGHGADLSKGPPAPGADSNQTPDELLADAKKAIAAGAPADAVKKKFKEMGGDPSKI